MVNAVSFHKRGIINCKKRLNDIKCQLKRKMGQEAKYARGTGGGPALHLQYSLFEEELKKVIGPDVVEGIQGQIDTDLQVVQQHIAQPQLVEAVCGTDTLDVIQQHIEQPQQLEAVCGTEENLEENNAEEYIILETVDCPDVLNCAGNEAEYRETGIYEEPASGPAADHESPPESPPATAAQRSTGPFSARRRTPGRGRPSASNSDHLQNFTTLARSYIAHEKKKWKQFSRHMTRLEQFQAQTLERQEQQNELWKETNSLLRQIAECRQAGRSIQPEEPARAVQPEEPARTVQPEEPARATVTRRVGLRRGGRRVRPPRLTDL
ncbi:uncharacterized protein LOC121394356 [Xenopus laevis]|uniref:Uncharacterized protein LOC121394356 n=1 Tax=Xenopus laevis TaxID=8355 RepID=A0A8J1KUX8_XENLA|nr:uncharacterized protein LOC121394356 [Xenopus laevis]